ncbi:methyltransferase [Pantoea sp. GD03673]|uniref:class I SAM-dependent methyltransferase n=1 Tax=Pantoea sp. GD03673 TaxID=2975364 RepID=UPI002446C70E|nr:methyltransferase [Pantoea sp. GD03673]MDH2066376.1 methyltransferase [Pantoea sp. GD03673]
MMLNNTIYKFRSDAGIWARSDYNGIPYSDGDNHENQLLEILGKTHDLSVQSEELKTHCNDWVTTYHFSSLRSNLLRPLKSLFNENTKVLEVGSGCGAITRYIGECGAQVLALEGSLRRAQIGRLRTKDLQNVTVVSERFDDFDVNEKFDVITLIGVLEYSNLFSDGIDSAVTMLNKIKQKLKPDGKLVIAIENQLGLKYFAGAAEDHVGQIMYGVEGRYNKEQAETYGHQVLLQKLKEVGLKSVETLLPFPDYKLPVSVVTEQGALDDFFNAHVFASQSVRADLQLPEKLNFVPELVWPIVFKNKLAIDLSNSFLLVAGTDDTDSYDKDILAVHYGKERHAPFQKRTVFRKTGSREVQVCREKENSFLPGENDKIDFCLDGYEKYISGNLLDVEFIKIVTTPGWKIEYVSGYFKYYIECLQKSLDGEGVFYDRFEQNTRLPPTYLDAIPSNFVVDEEGHPRYFEREWLAKNGLTLGHLVFRAVLSLLGKISIFAKPAQDEILTRGDFVRHLFDELSFVSNDELFKEYLDLESELFAYASGMPQAKIYTWYPEDVLPGLQEIHEAEEKIREKAKFDAELEKTVAEKHAINELSGKQKSEIVVLKDKIIELDKLNEGYKKTVSDITLEAEILRKKLSLLESNWMIRIIKKWTVKDN